MAGLPVYSPAKRLLSDIESTLKANSFLLEWTLFFRKEANYSLLENASFQKGGNISLTELPPLKVYIVPFNGVLVHISHHENMPI